MRVLFPLCIWVPAKNTIWLDSCLQHVPCIAYLFHIATDVLTVADFAIFNKVCDNFTNIIKFIKEQWVYPAASRILEHTTLGYLFLNEGILPKWQFKVMAIKWKSMRVLSFYFWVSKYYCSRRKSGQSHSWMIRWHNYKQDRVAVQIADPLTMVKTSDDTVWKRSVL